MDAEGHAALAIGVRRTDDGYGEAVVAVLAHEQFLAGDFVTRIFPMGVGKGRALGDDAAPSTIG